ncbi:MAG: serine/threonine protein kinase [Iphinoe sp. HA4291-MV1]|jgi:serine/threonine protein kinase|nr:serine/threonine protein kinase [Iphinoe sp. HA4291-MV1]
MCDSLPSTYKSSQPLEDGSILSLDQYNLLLNDRYRILKPLTQGGFGKTFIAVDDKNFQQFQPKSGLCVIKQFFPKCHAVHHYQKASELFKQEFLRLALLGKHPQIPQLLDTFEQDGQQYIVQEWIDGETLEEELVEEGTFSEAEIWQLLQELLPVLQFVHDHQVIHRDIKPANIIRRKSECPLGALRDRHRQLVLVDFGAAMYATNRILEKTGTLIGSAEYAAPEQIRGKAVFASDLYSLGMTCLHLLTQMSPFDLHNCGEDAWVWRSYLTELISPSLEQILCKLVHRATKPRYHSATEVLEDLKALPKHVIVPSKPSVSAMASPVLRPRHSVPPLNSVQGTKRSLVGRIRTIADDDDFETPYFGFSLKENLPASTISYAVAQDIRSIASVTVYDPQTQAWYHLPPKMEAKEIARKMATLLGPRLAGAAATPPLRDDISQAVSGTTISRLSNILWKIFTAIAATYVAFVTIACVAGIQSHLTNAAWKVENLRTKVRSDFSR